MLTLRPNFNRCSFPKGGRWKPNPRRRRYSSPGSRQRSLGKGSYQAVAPRAGQGPGMTSLSPRCKGHEPRHHSVPPTMCFTCVLNRTHTNAGKDMQAQVMTHRNVICCGQSWGVTSRKLESRGSHIFRAADLLLRELIRRLVAWRGTLCAVRHRGAAGLGVHIRRADAPATHNAG